MVGKPISTGGYILTIVDEFSCFLFAFPTRDRSSSTVIQCLTSLFQIFGPQSLHSDRGSEVFSLEMSQFCRRGVFTKVAPHLTTQLEMPNVNASMASFGAQYAAFSVNVNWISPLGLLFWVKRFIVFSHSTVLQLEKQHMIAFFTFKWKLPPIVEQGPIRVGKYAWLFV